VAQQRVKTIGVRRLAVMTTDAKVGNAPRLYAKAPNDLVTTDLMETKAAALGPARRRPHRRWQTEQGRLREANSSDDSAGGGTTLDGPMLTIYEVTDGEMTMIDQDTADECLEVKRDMYLILGLRPPLRASAAKLQESHIAYMVALFLVARTAKEDYDVPDPVGTACGV
jgi:hypothetical protein